MRGKCLSPFKLHGSVIARKLAVKREGEKCGRVGAPCWHPDAELCGLRRLQNLRILATPDAQVGCMLRTTTLSQSPQEAEGVAALATQLDEDGVAFVPPPGEKREETLRRFLAARQGDVRKAATFLKEDAAWRAAQAIDELREQDAAAVANPNLNPNPTRTRPEPEPETRTRTRTGPRARARALARCSDAIPRSCSVCFRRPSGPAAIARGSRWSSSTLARSAS